MLEKLFDPTYQKFIFKVEWEKRLDKSFNEKKLHTELE